MGASQLPHLKLLCLTCIASFIDFKKNAIRCPKCGSINIRVSGVTKALDDSEETKARIIREFEERVKNE